jgi:hypothetical protein
VITEVHIAKALQAVPGALGRQMKPLNDLASGANDALRQAPPGLTVKGAAAFLATMAQESAWFRTTEEYAKNGRYAPYIGRTFEQVTWKDNYRSFGKWCKAKGLLEDSEFFVDNPKRLADYRWAWLGGVWFFEANGIWAYANTGQFLQVQKAVNLGNPDSKYTPAGMKTRLAAYNAFLPFGSALLPLADGPQETEKPTVATEVIDGTEYTIRSSKRGPYVLYQGKAIRPIDLRKLLATTKYSTGKKFTLTQGGLASGAVRESAGTHDWLDVYDISIRGWTKAEVWDWCEVAQWNGIRPFPRGFIRDSFQGRTVGNIADGNEHLHVLCGTDLFPSGHPARYQQVEYDKQGDGLVGAARYTGPWNKVSDKRWEDSPFNPANRTDGQWQFKVTADPALLGLDAARQPKLSREEGSIVDAIAIVKRWDRDNAVTQSGTFYAMQYLEPVRVG